MRARGGFVEFYRACCVDDLAKAKAALPLECINDMLNYGEHFNPSECTTPIAIACEADAVTVAKWLLENDADTTITGMNGGEYERDTCMHIAAMHGNTSVMRVLLARGNDIDMLNSWGDPPIRRAMSTGDEKTVQFMIDNKATACGVFEMHDVEPEWFKDMMRARARCQYTAALVLHFMRPRFGRDMAMMVANSVMETRWNKEWARPCVGEK